MPNKPLGDPGVESRRVPNGVFWLLRSGTPWWGLLERFGPGATIQNRLAKKRRATAWNQMMDAITIVLDGFH